MLIDHESQLSIMRRGRVHRARLVAWVTFLATVGFARWQQAWADPWDRFSEDRTNCTSEEDCSICGVTFNCPLNDNHCTWGALTFDRASMEDVLHKGAQLYCISSGGVMLSNASAAGMQRASLATIFSRMTRKRAKQAPARYSAGGVFEVGSPGNNQDKIYGLSIPLSWTFALDRYSDIDAQGNLIVGSGGGLYQYGLTASPIYSRYIRGYGNEDDWQIVAGGVLPFQFVGTSGDGLEFGAAWLVGAGGLAGISRKIGSAGTIGLGATFDFRYAGGIALPFQLALQSAHDLSSWSKWLGTAVFQPGFALDFAAGTLVGDTMNVTLLVGMGIGSWVIGYYGSFQGSASAHGLGLTHMGRAGELAAGSGAEVRSEEESPASVPPAVTPPPPPPPPVKVPVKPERPPATQPTSAPAAPAWPLVPPASPEPTKPGSPTTRPSLVPPAPPAPSVPSEPARIPRGVDEPGRE